MIHKFFEEKRPHKGLTYQEYSANTEKYLTETDYHNLDEKEAKYYDYKKLNAQRSARVFKTFKPGLDLSEVISNISSPQLWMVITEDWCGDSAQNLPYIAEMAKLNPAINLRIISRDENLDIMDLYLTNGTSRSIPKLVAFDENGNELFQWGPRPAELVNLISEWKNEGLSKEEWMPKLHLWYAKNKGEAITREFKELLSKFVGVGV